MSAPNSSPNNSGKGASQPERPAIYEYENRGRTRWVIEVLEQGPDEPATEFIFGDSADRIVIGARDPIYQRDPVVRLTKAQHDNLAPHSRKLLDTLVALDEFELRERHA